ncbi:recombinase family protein [Butyrivibrio sp. WCE2006]|uniref:recombinase family protein n=1 Tax=Butyrivibrio sp. WCE2006 TaxID=1410611 RepID=UPI0005D2D25E|nr:recombinase family protein [Butyrivibrio sp. WCE2006]
MKYGYIRVSSKSQKNDGNSLEAQLEAVRKAGAEKVCVETFTGTKIDRPELSKLIDSINQGDMIIVTKMDRFARTVAQATETITNLISKGVAVYVLNLGVLDNSSMSVLVRNLLLSFAQFERDLIIERTQEGRAIARLKPNYKEGRPKKYNPQQIKLALELLENHSYNQVSLMTGISISTLTRAKREKKASSTDDSNNKIICL